MKVSGIHTSQILSVTTLIGNNVENVSGENLGKIEELVLHVETGKIAYAVLSCNDYLGTGNKVFAIPWDAFVLYEDKMKFILDIDKERLERASGFDRDNLPDAVDTQW